MEFDCIRAYDPAIDRDAMRADGDRWDRFLETRDAKLVVLNEGMEPVVYKCRTLTKSQRREADGMLDERKREHYFKLGVVSVVNLRYPDGSRRTFTGDRKDSTKPLKDSDLETFFSETDVQHVGECVRAYSFCPSDSPVFVPLLALCRDAIIAAGIESQRRRAELAKRQAAGPSAGDSESPKAPPQAT